MMINIFERNRSLASKAFDNPYPFEEIKNLENFWPWTMSIAGLIKWLSWETDNILGISKTKLIKQAIEYLNLFVSNTRINTEFYKETAEVKTTTKKTSDNTNVQIQSNDEDDIKNSVKNISPEIKSSICETRENVKNCSLGMDNCPTECR